MTRLARTIRFDQSDESVFHHAAAPGEWAISGAFVFLDRHRDEMDGKTRQAFNNGFLGLSSFGFSTFVCVAGISKSVLSETEMALAKYLYEQHGAPDLTTALEAARDEIAYASELCQGVPENTIFAVKREFTTDGRIKESFHKVKPPDDSGLHARIWTIEADE